MRLAGLQDMGPALVLPLATVGQCSKLVEVYVGSVGHGVSVGHGD